jgi:chromosome segregation ATPase
LKYGALAIVTAQTLSMIKYAFGNQSSELGGRKVQSLLAKDMTTILTTCQQELQEQERELKIYHDKKIECVNELRQCDSHGQTLHDELHKLSETIRHLNCEKMDRQFELAEFQEGTELDTNVIEQEEMELQQAIELMQTQHQQLQEEEISLQQELKRKQSVKTAAYQHLLELDQQLKEQESSIDHIMINRDQSKKLLNKFRVDAEEAEASHKVALEKQETLQKQVQQTLQLAYEAAKRLNPDWNESNKWNLQTSETRKALIDKKKELESQWKAHQQHYGNNDLSPRIAHERYQKAQRELKELEEQHNGLSSLLESLYHDRDDRKRRIAQVLHKSAKRVKSLFATYVSEKGACGAVIFDHNNKKLHLEYQVDDTDEHTAVNNVRNLAGGERSYVTFSLHLSLGHVVSLFH